MKVNLLTKVKLSANEFVGPGEVELAPDVVKGIPTDCYTSDVALPAEKTIEKPGKPLITKKES